MKALTVRHPWAWAITHGGKNVENRSRRTNYRGTVYIHAAQAMDFDAFSSPALEAAENAYIRRGVTGPFGKINQIDLSTCGMVIGTVELVGCHHADECRTAIESAQAGVIREELCSPWAMDGHYHWELDSPRPLACPFPEKGKLGIWNLLPPATT
jgi:hypothetical protein